MILSSLEVVSFGALVSQRLELDTGLNVVVGPNEAGKSTLFKALQHLLLTPVDLGKRAFQEQIRPLLPLWGGDTVSAVLQFQVKGESFRLEKSWGGRAEAELRLPDGARITDPNAVEAQLSQLLPVKAGTLRNVLLTYQSGLPTTIAALDADRETVHSLGDLLHRSVLETDGISVGRFQELLDSRYRELSSHWDLEHKRPEKKKGTEGRWSRERGRVLEAYYALEDAENRLQEIGEKETLLASARKRLEACSRELTESEQNLRGIERSARDAQQRSILEVKLQNVELSLTELRNDYDGWAKSLQRSQDLEKELPELQQAVRALELEKEQAQAFQQKQVLIERFERIQAIRERLQQAEEELKILPPLSSAQLNELRDSNAEIERLRASLQAGNLSLTFRAREALDLAVQKDIEEEEQLHLAPKESLRVEASGRIELSHTQWSLEVHSGQGEFKEVAERLQQAQIRFSELLKELGVSSLQEGEETSKSYERQAVQVQTTRTLYEQELGNDSYEALEAGAQPVASPPRELGQVLEELVRKHSKYQELQSELDNRRQTTDTFARKYGDQDALFARITELGGLKQQLTEQLGTLAAVPEGFSDAQSLLDHYNGLKQQLESLKGERIRLESECRAAENSLPDESSEEVVQQIEEARAEFNKQQNKAETLMRIRRAAEGLLAQMDTGIYEPFTALLSQYLDTLSGGRYRNVPAGTSLPTSLIREDGRALPYELLSAGTKDLFALGLRLAMADFFLNSAEGFLVLDDPLVDLDPQRQQRTAAVLAQFARTHQLLMFTCQPTHAELLGEVHRIDLKGS